MTKFYKYQSLGNDFILLDCIDDNKNFIDLKNNPKKIQRLCDRHFGIGADGVLFIDPSHTAYLFNSDGSDGQKCLNGLRCIAHYLYSQRSYPRAFDISMAEKPTHFEIEEIGRQVFITSTSPRVNCSQQKMVAVNDKKLVGYVVDVGNPHFVILESTTLNWLKTYGPQIEINPIFPKGTNVEFVWQDNENPDSFHLLVFERGCGITLACGTGALATMQVLFKKNLIYANQSIALNMLGGELTSYIGESGSIHQRATAEFIFVGTC